MEFSVGTLVKWKEDEATCYGLICSEPAFGVCDDSEVPVHVISRKSLGYYQGMAIEDLEKVDNPPSELLITQNYLKKVCKPGCGAEACKYLVMATNGFTCAKGSAIGW